MPNSEYSHIAKDTTLKKRRRINPTTATKNSKPCENLSENIDGKLQDGLGSFTPNNLLDVLNREASDTAHSEDPSKNGELNQIRGRQTGVKKVQARLSNLEATLAKVVPIMLKLSKRYQSQVEVDSKNPESDTTLQGPTQGSSVSICTRNDYVYDANLLTAVSPAPSKRLFLEYDYSYHLVALYFTIHEFTGQEPIISRRDFFDSLQCNTMPTYLVHAMFAFSARYSNHPLVFPNCLQFSKEFSQSSSVKACSSFFAPTIRSVQALLLLSSLGIQRGNPSSSWGYLGSAIRASQILGLDSISTDPQIMPISPISNYEVGFLKKLWDMCCSADFEVSMLLDKPRQIKEAPPPSAAINKGFSPLSPDQYVLSCISVLPPYIVECLKNTRTLLLYWKTIEEFHSALQPNHSPQETLSQISNLGLVIDSWHLGLPRQLSYKPEFFHPQVAQRFPFLEQVINLHIIHCRLKLSLFQPILENHSQFQSCPGFPDAKKKYWQSACSLVRILEDWEEWNSCSDGQFTLSAVCEIFNIPLLLVDPNDGALGAQDSAPPFLPTHFFFAGLAFLLSLISVRTSSENPGRLKYSFSTLMGLLTSTSSWDGSLKVAEKLQELASSIGVEIPQ
ncbi:hypothetical protein DSO57_1002943 [Entomophthora muscae]|uniref:Uncharacterized protein n=1 Tax=Entomophthora muscae TaxID=34485 RepID=A0ACC2T8A0_9FUNG|nr:hypothetical protein DSO57_1002943 [Entomophthora muscae]